MSKVVCHQEGVLAIKCKNCGYMWNTNVVINQEVDDTCPNCNTDTQEFLVINTMSHVDIPEFMKTPKKEVVTMESFEFHKIVREHYQAGRKLGFNKGLSIGISIGLIILGITLFLLFVPMTMLPV